MKDPAFLFYTDNFQSGTQFFTNEQVGKYIRLLCAQHLHGHLSEKQVLLICGTFDDEVMAKFAFHDGKYYNKRLELEIEKRRKFSESRANNRLGKVKKHKKITRKTSDKHLGNENENENGSNNIDYSAEFDRFRQAYPGTKRGNETEFENLKKKYFDWKEILPKLHTTLQKQITARANKKALGEFVPEWKHLQTWINQRCWEEEIPKPQIQDTWR